MRKQSKSKLDKTAKTSPESPSPLSGGVDVRFHAHDVQREVIQLLQDRGLSAYEAKMVLLSTYQIVNVTKSWKPD